MNAVSTPGRSVGAWRSERRYWLGLTLALGALAFVGFARTFYLHTLFGVTAPVAFIIFHGMVMSGWMVLFAVQAALISTRHVQWHRWLGTFGVGYAALMVVVGCMSTILAATRETRAHSPYLALQYEVLALEFTQMALFGGLVAAAVVMRRRYDWHKRLMLVATLCLLPNAIVRLSLLTQSEFLSHNIVLLTLWALFVAAVGAVDSVRRRGLHPAFGFAAGAAAAALYAAHFFAATPLWLRVARAIAS